MSENMRLMAAKQVARDMIKCACVSSVLLAFSCVMMLPLIIILPLRAHGIIAEGTAGDIIGWAYLAMVCVLVIIASIALVYAHYADTLKEMTTRAANVDGTAVDAGFADDTVIAIDGYVTLNAPDETSQ